MKIHEHVIEPGREDHIARHHVSVAEVEEVIFGAPFLRKARQGRYHIIGRTQAGRYLAVFVAPRGQGVYGLVTARDADDAERRDTYDKERTRTTRGHQGPYTDFQDD